MAYAQELGVSGCPAIPWSPRDGERFPDATCAGMFRFPVVRGSSSSLNPDPNKGHTVQLVSVFCPPMMYLPSLVSFPPHATVDSGAESVCIWTRLCGVIQCVPCPLFPVAGWPLQGGVVWEATFPALWRRLRPAAVAWTGPQRLRMFVTRGRLEGTVLLPVLSVSFRCGFQLLIGARAADFSHWSRTRLRASVGTWFIDGNTRALGSLVSWGCTWSLALPRLGP